MEFTIARVGSYAAALIGSAAASRTTCLISHRGAAPRTAGAWSKRSEKVRNLLENVDSPSKKPRNDRDLTKIRFSLSAIAYRTGCRYSTLPYFKIVSTRQGFNGKIEVFRACSWGIPHPVAQSAPAFLFAGGQLP
jgi:hypothetical protein